MDLLSFLERMHKTIARVSGDMSGAITKRSISKRVMLEWVAKLRQTADEIEEMTK